MARTKQRARKMSNSNGISSDAAMNASLQTGILRTQAKGPKRELNAWLFDTLFQHIRPGFVRHPDVIELQKQAWSAYQDQGDSTRLSLPTVSKAFLDAFVYHIVKGPSWKVPPRINAQISTKFPNHQDWRHWDIKVASGAFDEDAAGEPATQSNSESESGYVDAVSAVISEYGSESEVEIEGVSPGITKELRAWLFDAIYQNVPVNPNGTPNLSNLANKAWAAYPQAKQRLGLPNVNKSVLDALINAHISGSAWKSPPVLSDPLRSKYPRYGSWQHWDVIRSRRSQLSSNSSPRSETPDTRPTPVNNMATNSGTWSARSTTPLPTQPSASTSRPAFNAIFSGAPPQPPARGGFGGAGRGRGAPRPHEFRDTGYNQRILNVEEPQEGTSRWTEYVRQQTNAPQVAWDSQTYNLLAGANQLLDGQVNSENREAEVVKERLRTIPMMMGNCLKLENSALAVPQYGLLGKRQDGDSDDVKYADDDLIILNTNTPWTVFICGLQGAGKSHSLSVILENCLIPNQSINILQRPLSAIVFSFSPYSPVHVGKPCEAAYLASSSPTSTFANPNGLTSARRVTVLVSRSNFHQMQQVYGSIPNITVRPMLFKPSQLNINTMLKLMSFQQDAPVLYQQVVLRILRDMAAEDSGAFNYERFKHLLSLENLTNFQWGPLQLRLELLESFIGAEANPNLFVGEEGSIIIVDLTCPFVDAETACILFSICLDLYSGSASSTGKIVALDEAHKFMSAKSTSTDFAVKIVQNIRLQRHLGLRTIISTQDPQVHPELLELASFIMMHRFDSPRWYNTIAQHVGLEDERDGKEGGGSPSNFENIMRLSTGECLLYCPQLSAVQREWSHVDGAHTGKVIGLEMLGSRVMKVKIRQRITHDGGVSRNVL